MQRINKTTIFGSVVILFIFISLAAGKIIYVDTDAVGANNGSTWTDAYNFLQDALADANSASKPVEIRVAEGVYTPDHNSANPTGTGDREATFQLINGVAIRGGYAGLGEPDPNERDVDVYEAILSGDLAGNDVSVNDPRGLLDEPSRAENSYHVVTGSFTDEMAVLDGFTITRGHADSDTYPHGWGGGMFNQDASPTLINCTFTLNSAESSGGGILSHNHPHHSSRPVLRKCAFTHNAAGSYGGGMRDYESYATLTNCTFSGNWASEGGGMHISMSKPTLDACLFAGNTAQAGGGVYLDCMVQVTLRGCSFYDNRASQPDTTNMAQATLGSSTLSGIGGGILNKNDVGDRQTLIDCTFVENVADKAGGGVYNRGFSFITLTNCLFVANTAVQCGGGICNGANIQATLQNCTFCGNKSSWGGGIDNGFRSSQAILQNSTFYGNKAVYAGGGVHNYADRFGAAKASLTSCILWNNMPSEIENIENSEAAYSNIKGGSPGEGNIDEDPLFAEPGYWDPNGTPDDANDDFWIDGDYHLKSQAGRWDRLSGSWVKDDVTSPCIDAGDPASPIGHETFPNGGIINMGAYGGIAEASKSYFGEPVCGVIVAGDINGDCRIDFADFSIMALHWLQEH